MSKPKRGGQTKAAPLRAPALWWEAVLAHTSRRPVWRRLDGVEVLLALEAQ